MAGDMSALAEALKGYGGYVNSVTTVIIAGLMYWKGLPALIEAGAKLFEIWSNRAASIEDRLNASVKQRFDQFEHDIATMREQHKECQDENHQLRVRVKFLEDSDYLKQQEILGLKRRIAAYETSGLTPAIIPVDGAIVFPPNVQTAIKGISE